MEVSAGVGQGSTDILVGGEVKDSLTVREIFLEGVTEEVRLVEFKTGPSFASGQRLSTACGKVVEHADGKPPLKEGLAEVAPEIAGPAS